MSSTQYLHGYDYKEQKRLLDQAKFLEPYIFAGIELKDRRDLLEVGCGVGAQTKILCRRFPRLKVTGLDRSSEQLDLARVHLKRELKAGRVELFQGDAQKMDLRPHRYDSSFICWFLEHVPDPLEVLKRTRQQLRPGSKLFCTEVFNQTFFLEPYSPALLKYWFEFNDYQASIKGHPFLGASLGNLLKAAGFKNIKTELRPFHFDAREARRRAEFIEYFFDIFLSTEKSLLKAKRVTQADIRKMHAEVKAVKHSPNAVFFYAFMRATATA